MLMVLAAVAIVVALYSIANLGGTVYSVENQRVQLLSALLSGESSVVTEDSRVDLASKYIDIISERPILGYGTGFVTGTGQGGPHNTFLMLWVENGLPGLAGYLMLLALAFWYFRTRGDARGQSLCAVVLVFSIFENDVTELRTLVVALGLLSVLSVPERVVGFEGARSSASRRSAALLASRPDRGMNLLGASSTPAVR
jgi:O-antigen ligase